MMKMTIVALNLNIYESDSGLKHLFKDASGLQRVLYEINIFSVIKNL